MADMKYWIALSMLADIGPMTAKRLLSAFGTPEKIFHAQLDELIGIEGIGINRARSIRSFSLWKEVEKHVQRVEQAGIAAVSIENPSYPAMLKETDGAPLVLYVRGSLIPQDRYAIAVVGSRNLTHYGASVAERIAGDLARMGFTIVSGMARGVDSLAHKASLAAGGRTVAVLGSGVDIPYPPENKTLMEKIIASGSVISEFLPGTPPDKDNFPRRNRIISGLSLGILVVEAVSDSGALITARYATDQGREVFAIPGNITSASSEGTNDLIRKGATLVRHANDIVEELAPVLKGFIRAAGEVPVDITEDEKGLCTFLSGEPRQIDEISRESGLPSSKVLGVLLGLEMKGAVKQITGKRFYLA
jgi:DNA processing protein